MLFWPNENPFGAAESAAEDDAGIEKLVASVAAVGKEAVAVCVVGNVDVEAEKENPDVLFVEEVEEAAAEKLKVTFFPPAPAAVVVGVGVANVIEGVVVTFFNADNKADPAVLAAPDDNEKAVTGNAEVDDATELETTALPKLNNAKTQVTVVKLVLDREKFVIVHCKNLSNLFLCCILVLNDFWYDLKSPL